MSYSEPPRVRIPQKFAKPILVVADPDDRPVVHGEFYLAWNPANGRYHVGRSRPKKQLCKDYKESIWRFYQWVAHHEGESVLVLRHRMTMAEFDDQPGFGPGPMTELVIDKEGSVEVNDVINSTSFWSIVRNFILENPKRAAKKIGIEEIAYLAELPKPQPSITLDGCLELYVNKRKRPSDEELRKVKQAWSFFRKCVSPAKKLEDVSVELFDRWADRAFLPYEDGDGSPKTVRHKVNRVRQVLNYCLTKKGKDEQNCRRLLTLIRRLELPNTNPENPNPIGVDEFEKLLEVAAETHWKPMLLTMMNCCFYPCDIRRLPVNALDLDNGSVVFDRKKTGRTRVAVLWRRTMESLRKWLAENPSDTTVFLSRAGEAYSAQGLRNAFRKLRAKAGLGKEVTLNRIRDGAYTAAIQNSKVTEKEAKIIAGHRFQGETDAYVKRNPLMVRQACEAIEEIYFGTGA